MLAARAAAAGGNPLTVPQTEQSLLAIKASDANPALYHAEPEEMTAMLNRLFMSLEGRIRDQARVHRETHVL